MLAYIAKLPPEKNFVCTHKKDETYHWEDKSNPRLRISCEDPEPWDKTWLILPLLQQGKTRAGIKYPQMLRLKCIPLSEKESSAREAILLRERWKGFFAMSLEPTYAFYAFPCEGIHHWLMLSFIPKK